MPVASKYVKPVVLVISHRNYRFVSSTKENHAETHARYSLRTLNHSNKKLQELFMALPSEKAESEFDFQCYPMETIEDAVAHKNLLMQQFTDQGLLVLNKR